MNETERAALVDASDLRQVMDDFGFSVNLDFNDEHDDVSHTLLSMTEEVARLRVENARLLADRAHIGLHGDGTGGQG